MLMLSNISMQYSLGYNEMCIRDRYNSFLVARLTLACFSRYLYERTGNDIISCNDQQQGSTYQVTRGTYMDTRHLEHQLFYLRKSHHRQLETSIYFGFTKMSYFSMTSNVVCPCVDQIYFGRIVINFIVDRHIDTCTRKSFFSLYVCCFRALKLTGNVI